MEATLMIVAESGGSAVALARIRDDAFLRRAVEQALLEAKGRAAYAGQQDPELGAVAEMEILALERRLRSIFGSRCLRKNAGVKKCF